MVIEFIVGVVLCLYVMGLVWYVQLNVYSSGDHSDRRLVLVRVARDVWDAVVWPLAVLPWRDLLSEWWQRMLAASTPRWQS